MFVGVPRTMADGEGSGVPPDRRAVDLRDLLANRGVILIPTRATRAAGSTSSAIGVRRSVSAQLLYSDAIVPFLTEFAEHTDARPEILLSFGFVPKSRPCRPDQLADPGSRQ